MGSERTKEPLASRTSTRVIAFFIATTLCAGFCGVMVSELPLVDPNHYIAAWTAGVALLTLTWYVLVLHFNNIDRDQRIARLESDMLGEQRLNAYHMLTRVDSDEAYRRLLADIEEPLRELCVDLTRTDAWTKEDVERERKKYLKEHGYDKLALWAYRFAKLPELNRTYLATRQVVEAQLEALRRTEVPYVQPSATSS